MKFLLLALLPVLICSCATQNPQTRIQNNRPLFDALTKEQQEIVAQGRIDKGMPFNAVYLALGNPDRKGQGYRDGRNFERWDYTSHHPVMRNDFHYGYWGGGRYHRGWSGFGIGQSVEYIPYRSSSVWFLNGRVDSWEFIGPRR